VSRNVLLVGTRKGLFVLESDGDRRDWKARGPYCEGWPIYHAVYDPSTGTIYAAAASEWHGAAVWRSPDLGETWEMSSEGLTYGEDSDLKLSKVSGITAAHGRLLVAAEHTRRPPGTRRVEQPREPAARPPRPAGDHAPPR
jgi:hypothetical protein